MPWHSSARSSAIFRGLRPRSSNRSSLTLRSACEIWGIGAVTPAPERSQPLPLKGVTKGSNAMVGPIHQSSNTPTSKQCLLQIAATMRSVDAWRCALSIQNALSYTPVKGGEGMHFLDGMRACTTTWIEATLQQRGRCSGRPVPCPTLWQRNSYSAQVKRVSAG